MEGLDYLGAGEGLASQALVFRIRKIDPVRLAKAASAGKWSGALGPALAVVDELPGLALDMAAPVIQQQLEGYGITADVSATDAPVSTRKPSVSRAALAVGAVLGSIVTLVGRWAFVRFTKGAR